MTTLQKFATAVVQETDGERSWSYPEKILVDDGTSGTTWVSLGDNDDSKWLRLGFDFSALPAGTAVTGAVVDFLDIGKHEPFGTGVSTIEVQYWDGTTWQAAATYVPAAGGFIDASTSSFAVTQAILNGWSAGYGIRIRCTASGASATHQVYIGALAVTVTYSAPTAPTVTAISPAVGSAGGGTRVTITGTGFEFSGAAVVSAVTIGGVDCTEISVDSDTSLTCRVGAHAVGQVNVVVTNAGGSGTLTNGFTYLSVADNVVKAVKGGAVVGSSLASVTLWDAEPTERVYGGTAELWDSLTIADVNASNFGFVVSVVVGSGAVAKVDFAAARFYYTVPGLADPANYLAVLRVDADRQTYRPDLYQLPRNGFTVSNDPQIDRRITAGAEFRFSRQFGPGRLVEKVWHSRELWLDESVQGNTPGLQVWARVDEGVEFQLLDAAGDAATLRGTGPHEVFFPKGDQARGHYMQLIYRVPVLAAGQVAAAYGFRDGLTHVIARPKRSWIWETTLVLAGGEFEDKTTQKLSGAEQLERLVALAEPGRPAVPYRDPQGGRGYLHVIGLQAREVVFKEGPKANVLVANVRLRAARYE